MAPEIVAYKALDDFSCCRDTALFRKRTKCSNEDWSLTHSFYSIMGGLIINLPNGEAFPALPEENTALVERKLISLPIITRREKRGQE